jgi:hypothetical protein
LGKDQEVVDKPFDLGFDDVEFLLRQLPFLIRKVELIDRQERNRALAGIWYVSSSGSTHDKTTFLIHDRGAPISAGYATMGFWIGMSGLS